MLVADSPRGYSMADNLLTSCQTSDLPCRPEPEDRAVVDIATTADVGERLARLVPRKSFAPPVWSELEGRPELDAPHFCLGVSFSGACANEVSFKFCQPVKLGAVGLSSACHFPEDFAAPAPASASTCTATLCSSVDTRA